MFDVPHFDVHFYMVDEAARQAIDTNDPDFWKKAMKEPDRAFMPADYMPPPESEPVPGVSVHWADVTDPVFRGEPFDEVFIYGAWDRALTFLEPMITLGATASVSTSGEAPMLWCWRIWSCGRRPTRSPRPMSRRRSPAEAGKTSPPVT